MKNKQFNLRIGNIEIRNYKGLNIDGGVSNDYEIVQWVCNDISKDNRESCYVIAFVEKSSDGYNVRSVGRRPWELDDEDSKDYNNLIRIFFSLIND